MLKGFRTFVLRGNVVDLAVAVVIGAAFGQVVSSFVENLLTPLIAIPGSVDFSEIGFTVNDSTFFVGVFLNDLISFLLVAAAVYFFVVRPVNALTERLRPDEPSEDDDTRACPECLSVIPSAARRCAHCTAELVRR
jgi:large conductance mechanosensitive channel